MLSELLKSGKDIILCINIQTNSAISSPKPPVQSCNRNRSRQEIMRLTRLNELSDPMAKMSVEVASTIFKLCLPFIPDGLTDDDQEGYSKFNNQTLFALGAVCKWWREIVWTTPQMWTLVNLVVGPKNLATTTIIAKEWLERTRHLPLNIQIYIPHLPHRPESVWTFEPTMAEFTRFSEVLNASSERWADLDLRMPAVLLDKFTGRPANLRSICIINTSPKPYYNDYIALARTAEGEAKPAPTYLSITAVQFESIDASWSNLTRVGVQRISMLDAFDILLQAPRLERYELEDVDCTTYNDENAWFTPIIHQNLRHLRIEDVRTDILNHLCAENLLSFLLLDTLYIEVQYGFPISNDFVALLERSACPLVDLTFIAPFNNDLLIPMLKTVSSLRRLILVPTYFSHGDYTGESLFKRIVHTTQRIPLFDESQASIPTAARARDDAFLPELEYFAYHPRKFEDFDKIWDLIPGLFGVADDPTTGTGNNIDDPYRRPLVKVDIVYEPRKSASTRPLLLSIETWSRIMKLREKGLSIGITVFSLHDETTREKVASWMQARSGRITYFDSLSLENKTIILL